MITVNKIINLSQLDQELNGKGLIADLDEKGVIIAVGLAENNPATQKELEVAISNHTAEFSTPIEQKLQNLGLTKDELIKLLGL